MKRNYVPYELALMLFLSLALFISCNKDDDDDNPVSNAYAIGSSNNLLSFNISAPNKINSDKPVIGLQAGEAILAIDIRPATGQLYGLGSTSRLYMIDKTTAVATVVGTSAFTPALSGATFGFDFSPTVDRIRVISNTRQNIRLNPETGAVVGVDTELAPGTPTVSAAAYTNNQAASPSTTLYAIDPSTDKLYIVGGINGSPSPNLGVLAEVGALGINVDGNNGFDISGTDNKAYALLTIGSATKLYSINLTTGAATAVGDFTGPVKGLAVTP
jgi:hypothetical protein